jgi:hypothetical protein
MTKAQEPSSPQEEEGVLGVASEDKAEGDDTASVATKDAPGAEYTSGGGMKPGGRNSGVGASGGLTEPNDGVYKDTTKQVLDGAKTAVAIQAAAAAKGSITGAARSVKI